MDTEHVFVAKLFEAKAPQRRCKLKMNANYFGQEEGLLFF